MAVDTKRLPVESLAHVVARLAAGLELVPALELLAVAAVEATGADVGVVRVVDPVDGALVARAVAPAESALAGGPRPPSRRSRRGSWDRGRRRPRRSATAVPRSRSPEWSSQRRTWRGTSSA